MRIPPVLVCLSAAALAACGGTLSNDTPTQQNVEVASVRLFDAKGSELTQHIPLVTGQTTRVVVRLYAPDSREIATVPGGVELGFTFAPTTLASSEAVPAQPHQGCHPNRRGGHTRDAERFPTTRRNRKHESVQWIRGAGPLTSRPPPGGSHG
jgi:hypothetical protein